MHVNAWGKRPVTEDELKRLAEAFPETPIEKIKNIKVDRWDDPNLTMIVCEAANLESSVDEEMAFKVLGKLQAKLERKGITLTGFGMGPKGTYKSVKGKGLGFYFVKGSAMESFMV